MCQPAVARAVVNAGHTPGEVCVCQPCPTFTDRVARVSRPAGAAFQRREAGDGSEEVPASASSSVPPATRATALRERRQGFRVNGLFSSRLPPQTPTTTTTTTTTTTRSFPIARCRDRHRRRKLVCVRVQ